MRRSDLLVALLLIECCPLAIAQTAGPVSVSLGGAPETLTEKELTNLGSSTQACARLKAVIRKRLVRRALVEVGRLPSDAEVASRSSYYLPSRAAVEKRFSSAADQQDAIRQALTESRGATEDDFAIWQKYLSQSMTYEEWISLRAAVGERKVLPVPRTLSAEQWDSLKRDMSQRVLEEEFQDWVRSVWAAHRPGSFGDLTLEGVPWTRSLQNAFWEEYLGRSPVRIDGISECSVAPGDLFELTVKPSSRSKKGSEVK